MTSRLSSGQLTPMSPLLGSLARLVAKNGSVSEEQLTVLLDAVDLEISSEGLQELHRWVRLLHRVYESPNTAMREVVTEALMQRGLLEASMILAISAVTEGSSPDKKEIPRVQDRELKTNVSNLNFGTLEPGHPAKSVFAVQGGPGQIVVESDHVLITPHQFGVEPT